MEGVVLLLVFNQKESRQLRIHGLYSTETAAIVLRFEYRVVRLHGDIDGDFTFDRQFGFKSTVPQPCDGSLSGWKGKFICRANAWPLFGKVWVLRWVSESNSPQPKA